MRPDSHRSIALSGQQYRASRLQRMEMRGKDVKLGNCATAVASVLSAMCAARALGLPKQTPTDTVQSVRDPKAYADSRK
jgi:hypothetical protein